MIKDVIVSKEFYEILKGFAKHNNVREIDNKLVLDVEDTPRNLINYAYAFKHDISFFVESEEIYGQMAVINGKKEFKVIHSIEINKHIKKDGNIWNVLNITECKYKMDAIKELWDLKYVHNIQL